MAAKPKARVLTIDDEFMLRQSIVAYLEDSDFQVYEAENGEKGLEVFRQEKPNIVLTDLQMPGISGLEVLATIKKEAPDVPVVVVSGAGRMDDVIEALRRGAWDYLTKPITDLAVLEHAINKCLERGRLLEENKAYREELEIKNQALQKNLATLEEDQKAGKSVQTRLLPEIGKKFSQYQFQYHIVPSLYLSGDFVDYFEITPKQFGFYIADVSGHGASSAFVTVLLRSLVHQILTKNRAGETDAILMPDKMLALLATEVHAANLGKYLTMVYGVMNTETRQLDYSIGGHYPNPIVWDGKEAHFLEGKGFPVGIMKNATYIKQSVSISEHSELLLFSDGVMEILEAENTDLKEKLLLEKITKTEGKFDKIIEGLGLLEQKQNPDDVTLLLMQCD